MSKVCIVSEDHDAIEWLVYQLLAHTEVELIDFKSARNGRLRHFDWVIFDVSGHSLSEQDIVTKIGGRYVIGRAIVRLDLNTARVTQISGAKLVNSSEQVSTFLEIMHKVQA